MKYKWFYVECVLILGLLVNEAFSDEEQLPTMNATNDDSYSQPDNNEDHTFSSSSISEKVTDAIGMPKSNNPKSHHHEKHRNPIDSMQPHTRSPVYEVNQPCYSPGCGTYNPQDSFTSNRWQPGRNRYGPYPRPYEQRRRGGYGYRETYPAPGYGPAYGSPYPDYGYGQRGMPIYPQDRHDRFGGYNRSPYDDYFLG